MNKQLTEQIINHVFSNLLIINNSIDSNRYTSIVSNDYLLPETISFENDKNKKIVNKIWGVELLVENQKLKMLLANCSIDNDSIEYALCIKLEGSPAYGLYSVYTINSSINIENAPLISISIDGQNWMTCNTYLQATFLAAMENIKQIPYTLTKCKDYKDEYNLLISFIKYHESLYGDDDEG